ncbi:MAG: hypothetical protein JWO95_604 [Verrucomicrobiales bacterium]|nr:hypothetical protein [Verrucomicrobiales bacterium]
MKTSEKQFLSPEACREAVQAFLGEQINAEKTRRGVVMALPLMYPDGYQVQVHLEPVTKSTALITDRGRTLAKLLENGLNLDAKQTLALLDERKQMFEVNQAGFELQKEIRLPLQGIDVHLFAESLVSIAHLIYKYEPVTSEESVADRTLKQIFKERGIEPTVNAVIDGKIEKQIRVNYLLSGRHPLACKVVKRRGPMLGYMEQWGWRWTDVKQHNPHLLRGMIYDPDKQEWDDTTLNICKSVCDLFCPYLETQTIHDAIDRAFKNGN